MPKKNIGQQTGLTIYLPYQIEANFDFLIKKNKYLQTKIINTFTMLFYGHTT